MKYMPKRKNRARGNRIGMPTPKVIVVNTTFRMYEYL